MNPFEGFARAVLETGAIVIGNCQSVVATEDVPHDHYEIYLVSYLPGSHPNTWQILPVCSAIMPTCPELDRLDEESQAMAGRLSDPLVALRVLGGGVP